MAVYKDTAQMYEVLGELWQSLLDHPESGPKMKGAGLTVKYNLRDPDGTLWITPDGVKTGDQDIKADVEMNLAADTAHKFWLNQVSLPVAMAKRLITSKGSMDKVMKLLPLLGPNYENYPGICDKYGLPK
ncbi:MAG: SCP2 sterol-binding domain-containing protein [Bacillota bacterium]